MAGNAQVTLQVYDYPNGITNDQKDLIVKGTALIAKNTSAITQITGWSITSNVLTFTAVNALTTGGGDVITVSNFTGDYTFLNGTYTTSSATATTVVVPLTHANGSGSQTGVAVVQGSYQTAGIPILYTFTDLRGNKIIPNLGISPVPSNISFQTLAGSALNYKVNTVASAPLLLIFTGITQVSDATAITADTVGFIARFPRGEGGSGY